MTPSDGHRRARISKCIHAVLQKLGVSNTSQYTYHSLGRRKDKRIRILLLKPGPWDSPIECELHTTKIDHAGTYEALSYVWGSPNPPAEILLHGRKHTVTPNLESALRHLRFDDRPRRLWVDALCINQADFEERSVQVRMIADIYARAQTTVSWLGEADEESDEAMELIRTLGSWLREHESALDEFLDWPLRPREAAAEVERLGFPLRERNWPAVWRLLERPYWTRMWIIQELAVRGAVTTAGGRIYCGKQEVGRVQFDSFAALILMFSLSGGLLRFDGDNIDFDEPFKSMLDRGQPAGLRMVQTLAACTGEPKKTLDYLVRFSPSFGATEPWDKLFALLGLAADGDLITPDYKASFDEVLGNFIVANINRYKSLGVILGNRYRETSSGPSWLPDLLTPELRNTYGALGLDNGYFQAAGSQPASVVSIDLTHGRICLRGITVGTIDKAIGPLPGLHKHLNQASGPLTMDSSEVFPAQLKFFREDLHAIYKALPESRQESFWRTLCMDCDWTQEYPVFPAPADYALKQRICFGYEPVPAEFEPHKSENERVFGFMQSFLLSIQTVLMHRTFITLGDGSMGVGPFMAQAGDTVAVLYGAPYCVVLRPVGSQYKLVGDAYVHGLMHGECVARRRPGDGEVFELV